MANLPVPVPRTYTVAEVETGAFFNSQRDAMNFVLNAPMASLYQVTSQSVGTSGTWTAITMDGSLLDTYGGHSNSVNPSRYTAQVAGWYSVGGGVGFQSGSGSGRGADVYKNGAFITAGAAVVGSSGAAHVTPLSGVMVFMNVGDYVEIFGWQNSGGALSTYTSGGQYNSYAFIRWEHS